MSYKYIIYEAKDHIATITLNRPNHGMSEAARDPVLEAFGAEAKRATITVETRHSTSSETGMSGADGGTGSASGGDGSGEGGDSGGDGGEDGGGDDGDDDPPMGGLCSIVLLQTVIMITVIALPQDTSHNIRHPVRDAVVRESVKLLLGFFLGLLIGLALHLAGLT